MHKNRRYEFLCMLSQFQILVDNQLENLSNQLQIFVDNQLENLSKFLWITS